MNGNAYNGRNKIKRMEMVFKNHSYLFNINPEVYDFKIPNRVNVHYTKGGAIVDLFGSGLKELSIVGTTGYSDSRGNKDFGYKKFLELKKAMLDVMDDIKDGKEVKDFLNFYNHTDGEAYVTVPIRLNISRNVNQPLIYKYDIQLYVLRRVGDPPGGAELQVIGNPLKSPSTVADTVTDRNVVEKGESQANNFSETNVQAAVQSRKQAPKKAKKVVINVRKKRRKNVPKAPTISTGRNMNSRS